MTYAIQTKAMSLPKHSTSVETMHISSVYIPTDREQSPALFSLQLREQNQPGQIQSQQREEPTLQNSQELSRRLHLTFDSQEAQSADSILLRERLQSPENHSENFSHNVNSAPKIQDLRQKNNPNFYLNQLSHDAPSADNADILGNRDSSSFHENTSRSSKFQEMDRGHLKESWRAFRNVLGSSSSSFSSTLKWHLSLFMMLALVSSSMDSALGMQFERAPENTSQLLGRSVILSCRIRNMEGDAQWSKDDLLLGTDRNIPWYPRLTMWGEDDDGRGVASYDLKIANIEVGDQGSYSCQVPPSENFPSGLKSEPAYLTVIVPPENLTISTGRDGVEVYLNKPTNITCIAYKSKPAAHIIFRVNGVRVEAMNYEIVQGSLYNTIGVLTYNATKEKMSSRVECEATIPHYQQHVSDRLRVSQILDVLFVPNITMRTNASTSELHEKQAVRFHCTGESNPSIVTWRWERNDTTIPGATSDTYIIPDISHDYHNNKISCIATNSVGSSRVDRRLNVKYGARIVHITEVVGADLDKPTELKCEAIGNPAPIVTWRRKNKGGRVADSGHRSTTVSVHSVYRIDRVTAHSFGWYVCTATVNNFPPASAEAMLLKNDRPNLRSEKEQMATEGKAARLECLAHSIPKPDRVTWYGPGGKLINFATSGRFSEERIHMLYGIKSILHITSAQSGDFGYYNCTITNAYGTVSEKIQLVEKHVLPITFIIIGVIAGVVVMFVAGLACVLYMRCRNEKHQGSVLGSYTDTDSSSDKTVKKRDKLDSPSTLMGQLRQDYNKEMYRFSADYDDMPYKDFSCVALQEQPQKANNNGYGYIEPYEAYSDHQVYDGEYVHRGDDLVPERLGYDPLYGSGNYSMSSFRANNYDTSTPPPTMTRLTPLHMSNSKLATDV